MYVIINAVSIHLKINIIMKSKNVWQKLLVGNEGLKPIVLGTICQLYAFCHLNLLTRLYKLCFLLTSLLS